MDIIPKVKFCEAIKLGWNKGCNFSGRARRSEYWYFFLFINLISLFLMSFVTLFLILCALDAKGAVVPLLIMAFICGFYGLIVMVPFLSCVVRRLHDTGRSGYYFFISFIPLYGMVAITVYLCLDSEKKDNEFGPSTKYICSDFANIKSEELLNTEYR